MQRGSRRRALRSVLRGALAHPAAVPALAELSAGPDLLREMREELEAHVLR